MVCVLIPPVITIGMALMGQVLGPVNYHLVLLAEFKMYYILANIFLYFIKHLLLFGWISERSERHAETAASGLARHIIKALVASTGSEFSFRPSS